MRRNILYVVVLLALVTTRTVAEEKKDTKAKKQTPTTQATKAEKSPEKPSSEATEKTKSTEPVQPKLDKDGLYQIEKNIVDYTNRERVRRGLKPLKIDKKLVDSARGQAQWMTKVRRLQHTRKPVGENIAMGYRTSKDVVRGWMNSSGHRANILNSGYRRIGVAAYKAKDGTVWWCQQFLR